MGPYWTNQMRDFAVLFAVVLLNFTGLHASCPLEIDPPGEVVVPYGGSILVHCRPTSPASLESMGLEAPRGGTSLGEVKNLTWNLEKVTNWGIKAFCYANLPDDDEPCSVPINVILYKFPENVTITDGKGSLDIGELDEGMHHLFLCNISDVAPLGNVTVTWYIGNRTVFIDGEHRDKVSSFSYEPRREDNGLHIRCQVHFNLGPSGPKEAKTSRQYLLRIKYPPKNITQLEDTELEVGSSGVLKCFSEGNPPLKYHWDYYKTGNVEVRDKDGGSHLYILNATEVNIGNYKCTADNDLNAISYMATVTIKGARSQCPIEMTPGRLVMPHGGRASVTCGNGTEDASRNILDISWRVGQHMVPGALWDVGKDTDWDPRAECVANISGIGECSKPFDVTFYKMADEVLIHSVGHTGAMVADTEYQLQCDILNVAPVQNLTVRWYQGDDVIEDKGSVRVTGCPHQNKVDCDINVIRAPVNVSSDITVTLRRNQTRAQFRCEAHLDLEPQPPPPMMSRSLNVAVHYEPIINSTKLPSRIPVFRGYPEDLVCEAEGRPAPKIQWFSEKGLHASSGNLTVTEAGVYTCNATNVVGSSSRVVEVTVLLKETADEVLIHSVGHTGATGAMVVDTEYQLQCDILNVASVENLTVRWYQGEDVIEDKGSVRVTGCPQNKVDCDIKVIRAPVNMSSDITVTLRRNQTRAQFRCEAHLDLEPQPPPPMMSRSLNVTVHYEPIINSTKLPSRIPVFRGYPEDLVCEADGRPAPKIQWFSEKGVRASSGNLTVTEAGVYTCNATNVVGSSSRVVEVVLKEDYLPIIAGLVAVTVLIISAVFVFFYSIYYKNTKMRRYSLKNPKLNTPNGNVAHNSWETSLPMTKLS